jgi:3-methylfumaryl-CoA hydratase
MSEQSSDGIDLGHLRGWVGREQQLSDDLHPSSARALAAALDHARIPDAGEAMRPGWQWLYFIDPPSAAQTGADGHPHLGEFLPPVPLPRRMWAAGQMQIEQPLRLGVPAQRHSVITAVDAKNGKTGALVFVTVEHRYTQDGWECIRETQNLVYRQMPDGPAPLPPGEPAPASSLPVCTVTPDPVLLFRYSALTYNSHRIHYDRPYATQSEFYPALVVHGPLLATLLVDYALEYAGESRIASFSFRAQRPTFDTHPFTLSGRRDDDRLTICSADHDGLICVQAEAVLA